MNMRLGGVPMEAGQLERYCLNNRLSFISSILVSAVLLVAMWEHVPHGTLLVWLSFVVLTQSGQTWYSIRYQRSEAGAEQQADWVPGLMIAAIATGLVWGSSFFMLGLSDGHSSAVLMIFVMAGVTAYAGIAKADVFPLAIGFEAAVLLPMCLWLFVQDTPVAISMGIIGLLYLLLLYFLLHQINGMVQRVHTLTNENSDLIAALARELELSAQREHEFRTLAENMPEPIIRYAPDGTRRYINPAFEHFFGMPRDKAVGSMVTDYSTVTDPEGYAAKVLEAAQGANLDFDVVTTAFSEPRTYRVYLVPEMDANQMVTGVLAICHDLTEIRNVEAITSRFFSNMPGFAFTFRRARDGRMSFPFSSPGIEKLVGLRPDEVRDDVAPLMALTHPDDVPRVMAAVEESAQAVLPFHVDFRVSLPGEAERWIECRSLPQSLADGELLWHGVMLDITERKRMEEEVAKREQEFRSLAESAPDNIVRYDNEGRHRYLNDRLVRQLGLNSLDEVIGKRPGELWPDGRFAELEETAARVFASGDRAELEFREPDGKGGWLDYLVSVVAERNEQDEIVGTIAFGRSITHLRSTERLMQMIGDHMPGALTHYRLRADMSGELLYASRGLKNLYGFTHEELADGIGPMIARIHPDDLPQAAAEQEHAAKTLTTAVSEFRVNHPEKGEIWVQQITTPVPESEGSQLWYSLMFDITERKQSEYALAEREAFLNSLLDAIPIPVFYKDRGGKYLGINRAFENFFGAERVKLIGKSVFDTHPKELAETYHAKDLEVLERRVERQEYEFQIKHSNGTLHDVLFSKAAFADAHGQVKGLIGAVMDITERKHMELELADREREFRTLVENSADTVARYDCDLRRVYANPAFSKQIEGGVEALLGKRPSEMPGGEGAQVYEGKLSEVISSGKQVEFELRWHSKDDRDVYTLINLTPEFDKEGNVASVLAVGRDITELHAYRQKIHRMAFYDQLTSLPNRALFNDRLRQMVTDASWHNQLAGVMMIDMDRFKTVNDTMGHAVGDELLRETGLRLSTCVRAYDTVARLGGDEFAVLLPDVRSGDDLGTVAEKMRSVFDRPFLLAGKEVFVSCSIGIALYPDDSTDADDLVKYADSAMYYAKRSGRNNFRFYANKLTESANERLTLESELRHALERNELSLHFQPKVRLDAGMMIGSEALLRWQHPQRGFVPPDKFISIAEDSGLIIELGEWVLREACRMACEMNGVGKPLHKVAINLSARQFMSNDLVGTVTQVLEETGCYPEWIELEITESLLLDEYGDVLEMLKAFRTLGITIAIDDFGTGYSALSYLARFPINTLKIDRSFISTVTTDKYCAELVKAILSIAHSLGQQAVAEGVETAEQALFLQAHGCQVAQGYWFSKPVPNESLLALSGNFELERLNKSSNIIIS